VNDAVVKTRVQDLYVVCDGHSKRLDDVEAQVKHIHENCEISKDDRAKLHAKIDEFHIKQLEQGIVIESMNNEVRGFIAKHKEDAPKAIKTMKKLISTQIVAALAIIGFVMTFMFWQTQRIITLQDKNIQLNLEVIKNEEKK
jgi:hypothetical protein